MIPLVKRKFQFQFDFDRMDEHAKSPIWIMVKNLPLFMIIQSP